MATQAQPIHVFVLCFPVQGQINPLLRLGKRLASEGGFLVTFATTSHFGHKIVKATGITPGHPSRVGAGFLRFEFFDDECADVDPRRWTPDIYLPHLERVGRKHVPEMLLRLAKEGRPVSCLVNGTLVPWACDIAHELKIPIATIWVQSCASFLTFYYYYNKLVPFPTQEDPYADVEVPTLPLLKWDELHSFLHPNSARVHMKNPWLREFANLNKPFCILIDTFDELEHDTIEFSSKISSARLMPVGPLFKDQESAIRGDQLKADFGCLRWLDSKPRRSVVYVSFGSSAHLKQEQINEIAYGILNAGIPFLWVMMPPNLDRNLTAHTLPNGFLESVGNNGRIVDYSPQEEVLAHPAVACFVTHCRWNSTVEALTSGVPMVAYPQWGDQLTNAKFVVDVLGVATRMGRGEHEAEVVIREEVERCLKEATVGPKAAEMRRNALAWKDMAEEACRQGGSSSLNLLGFVEEIRRRSRAQ